MCKKPLKAFPLPNQKTKNGKQAYKICSYDTTEIFKKLGASNDDWHTSTAPMTYHPGYLVVTNYVEIPCGQCIDCRLKKAKEWSIRCMCEAKYYSSNYFITFTYDDEHLPLVRTADGDFPTLVKKDLTDLFKRMRYYGYKFRYFACGEYGSNTHRPHYHVCFFGLELTDLQVYKSTQFGNYYNSPELEKIWGKGFVVIAPFSFETAGYTARYTLKKTKEDNKAQRELFARFGLQDEYIVMSRMPGLGLQYYEEHKDDIYDDDIIYSVTLKGVKPCKPPKYFDKYFESEEPELFELIKENRQKSAYLSAVNKDLATSLDRMSRLANEEAYLLDKSNKLPRKEI